MASEWARGKVERIIKLAECIHEDDCEGPYGEEPCDCWVAEVRQEIAAALDEARAEGAMRADQELYKRGLQVGAERERWEIAHLPEMQQSKVARDDDGKPNAWNTQLLIYAAIAARGPMRGPEEE